MPVLGNVMELVTRDNRLGEREYGGAQVKMQFMKQLSSRILGKGALAVHECSLSLLKMGHVALTNWSSAVRGVGEGDNI
eukprot:1161041-Pelagomonas_calceolata.AAC.5